MKKNVLLRGGRGGGSDPVIVVLFRSFRASTAYEERHEPTDDRLSLSPWSRRSNIVGGCVVVGDGDGGGGGGGAVGVEPGTMFTVRLGVHLL